MCKVAHHFFVRRHILAVLKGGKGEIFYGRECFLQFELVLREAVEITFFHEIFTEVFLFRLAGGGYEDGFFVEFGEVHQGGVARAAKHHISGQHGLIEVARIQMTNLGNSGGNGAVCRLIGPATYNQRFNARHLLQLGHHQLFEVGTLWFRAGDEGQEIVLFFNALSGLKPGKAAEVSGVFG